MNQLLPVVATPASLPRDYDQFDEIVDVVVVGYGLAGMVAAITAHDAGAQVLLIEKLPFPGGISICAGGGVRYTSDSDAAFAYLRETNAGKTPDTVLRAFADGLAEVEPYTREFADLAGATLDSEGRHGNYKFAGYENLPTLKISHIPGFDATKEYPAVRGRDGVNLFKVFDDGLKSRGIDARLSHAAERLITGPNGDVRGVWVRNGGEPLAVGARRAVVLACGGFESSAEMQAQYWPIGPIMTSATLGNTGDGIRMAQDIGADLWHMWHFHGSYGYRHPDPTFPYAIRVKKLPNWTPGHDVPSVKMAWILVNSAGLRFSNEYEPYVQDTSHRVFAAFDTVTQSYPHIPAYLIADEDGRKLYPLGHTVYNDDKAQVINWSRDNLAEIEAGILRRFDTLDEIADHIGASRDLFRSTIARWNEAVLTGGDEDFGRPPATMMPIAKPPFLVGEVWPFVSNTQGGPVHNEYQQVLNPFGAVLPRLYEAGELGSIWGHLYLSGANLSECIITGRIAGERAAAEAAWN